MATQKPSIPKGTRDFGPAEVQKRRYILNTIQKVFEKYGFMPLETPAMENLSTLSGKYGDEGDQLLFKMLNSGDYLKDLIEYNDKGLGHEEMDRTLLPSYDGKLSNLDYKKTTSFLSEKGLRYDLTVPFARYVVMHRNEITFPFKRYQMQPVWRADRPQKGRYREFWQCDADVVGSDSLLNEVDLVNIYIEVFNDLKIPTEIIINNRKILEGIAKYCGAQNSFMDFCITLDKLDKIGIEAVIKLLKDKSIGDPNKIQIILNKYDFVDLDSKDEYDILNANFDDLNKEFSECDSKEGIKGIEELSFIFNHFKTSSSINIKFDYLLARGLEYYTGCILEVRSGTSSLKSSIGGGGRYDNLTGNFDLPGVSGVGISFGLDRIYDVMEELNLFPPSINVSPTKVLCCCFDEASQQYALTVLKQMRDAGIASEIYPDLKKLNKQLDYANALKIPYAIIIGENEMKSGKLMLKDLNSGQQEELTIQTIIDKLK